MRPSTLYRSFAPNCTPVHFRPSHAVGGRRRFSTADLDARKGDRERVVVLGSGWAGFVLSRQLSAKKFQTVVVSPRSYFVFTPLLAGSAVGSQEFRTILEPVRNRKYPNVEFLQAWADDVDFHRKAITIEESVVDEMQSSGLTQGRHENHTEAETKAERNEKKGTGKMFDIPYDKLVVAVGSYSQTFGTKGVRENAFFLKDVGDARKIRTRVLECFEIASLPTTDDALRRQILHFAVIGGGPTGMEFAAELSDLVHDDMVKIYPRVKGFVKVTVYDVAPKVLSMFDDSLAKYAAKTFARQNISIKTSHHVEELRRGLPKTTEDNAAANVADTGRCYTLRTKEEGDVGVGLCIWSTGNMPNPFVEKAMNKCYSYPSASIASRTGSHSLPEETQWMVNRNSKTGVLIVDNQLRVQLNALDPTLTKNHELNIEAEAQPKATAVVKDVFAIGDNAAMLQPLPATAQVANQQALWLGKRLNAGDLETQAFDYKNMGVMAYIGGTKGLLQTGNHTGIKGRTAWLIWRGAYVTMAISWRNKMLIPIYWLMNWLFGRDISRF